MNFLGHAFLSFGDAEILTGNMMGDFVKGKAALEQYPEKIKKGILLHRKIDEFADHHPASARAKVWFRETYGLYSGPIIDILYDHFLANDPKHFVSEEALQEFAQNVYQQLGEHQPYFTDMFTRVYTYMTTDNWLYNYRQVKGMEKAFKGLSRRATHMPPPDMAYRIFITHYHQLTQCYYEFMDDVINFVKVELNT